MIYTKTYPLVLFSLICLLCSCSSGRVDTIDYWDINTNDLQKNSYSGTVKSVHYYSYTAHESSDSVILDEFSSASIMNFNEDGYLTSQIDSVSILGKNVPISYEYSYKDDTKTKDMYFDDLFASRRTISYQNNRPVEVIEYDADENIDSRLSITYDENWFVKHVCETDSAGNKLNERFDYVYDDYGYPISLNYIDFEKNIHYFNTYTFDERHNLDERCEYMIPNEGDTVLLARTVEDYNNEDKLEIRNTFSYNEDGSTKEKTVTHFNLDHQWWEKEVTYDAQDNVIKTITRQITLDSHKNCTEMLIYNDGKLTDVHYFDVEYYE